MLDAYVMYYLVSVLVVSVVSTAYLYLLIEKRANSGTSRLRAVEKQQHDDHMMIADQLERIVRLENANYMTNLAQDLAARDADNETALQEPAQDFEEWDWPELRNEPEVSDFVYTLNVRKDEKAAPKKGKRKPAKRQKGKSTKRKATK